jgi:hypothetical protein
VRPACSCALRLQSRPRRLEVDGLGNPEFGPLALTRAMCPMGSLHDELVRQWPKVRSYELKAAASIL